MSHVYESVKSVPVRNKRTASSVARHKITKRSHPIHDLKKKMSNQWMLNRIQRCPLSPQRCPTGGVCHLCPESTTSSNRGYFQPKLKIGQPNDKYEQEADRVAEQVMSMPEPKIQKKSNCPPEDSSCSEGDMEEDMVQRLEEEEEEEEEPIQTKPIAEQITPLVQRQEEEEEEEEPIQTKPIAEQITPLVQRQVEPEEEEEFRKKPASEQATHLTPSLQTQIQSLKGYGRPLSQYELDFFEPRFGRDLSQVRMYNNPGVAKLATRLNAKAFTVGNNIYFGAGQYSPTTIQGKKLLAHELTHTIQQKILSQTQKSSVSYLQMWRLGRIGEPLPHPNYQVVPISHRKTVRRARNLVKKVVNNVKVYPGCRRYFEKKCGAGLDPHALKNSYNNVVVWYSTMNGTSFGGSMPGTHHIRYSPLAYRLGRWAIASTAIHEMFHRCDLAVVDRELRAMQAEEKCRFYIPFIFELNPKEGKAGDEVTIKGTNFGESQGKFDKIEFNGVDAGKATTWGIYSIKVKVPPGATSGPVVVTNNKVPSNKVIFVIKK